jgi:hypothetical protein
MNLDTPASEQHRDASRTPDRRTVLAGASATALGVSTMLLPSAAAALSPGTQSAPGVFGQLGADITSTTTGIAGNAKVERSFAHGGKRYFLDTANYQLLQFSAAGAFEQLITLTNPPSGQRATDPSSFLVHGDATYLAMTRNLDVGGTPTPHLSVMRVDLSTPLGTTVTPTYWNLDLLASGVWGTRTLSGTAYPNVVSGGNWGGAGVSALTVDTAGTLRCVMNLRSDEVSSARAHFIDLFNVPSDFSTTPSPVNLYASTTSWPLRASRANAVTVGEYAIFFHDSQNTFPNPTPALRVPASPANWSLLPSPLPSGYTSLDNYSNEDRSMVVVDGALWAMADYYTSSASGAAAVRFDLAAASVTAGTDPSLPITAVVVIPASRWTTDAIATDGSNLYVTFNATGDKDSVARILLTGAGAPVFDASVEVDNTDTMQGMDAGALAATTSRTFVRLGNVPA